ncbi:hypothetical protein ACQ4LE_000580 [Meloidogyne hapla]|uniref:Dymeclin n=1 Tax=Meloidogyne hapla TaxID=6305 RepID=A0A1I8C2Z5_MELHA
MGAVISNENLGEISLQNELLQRLAGRIPLNSNDPYWNKLFSFNFNLDQQNKKIQSNFLENINPILEQLMHNTRETGNFATLIRTFNRRCGELEASAKCENKIFIWQAANALLIIRYISVFLAQRLSPTEFTNIFGNRGSLYEAKKSENNENEIEDDEDVEEDSSESKEVVEHKFESAAEHFLVNLLKILTRIQVNKITIQLHAETLRVLLALLSTELYEDGVHERSVFLQILMLRVRSQSGDIVRVLLENFLQHHSEPLDLAAAEQSGTGAADNNSSSFVISLWSTLQRTLSFGGGVQEEELDRFPTQSLSALSLTLLLALIYYPAYGGQQNSYKQMLSIFQNAQEVSSLANLEASFKLDFTQLYNRLCQTVYSERPPLLLLYLLIHNNVGFRNFVHSRVNLEQLVLPVIRVLFDGMCTTTGSTSSSPSNQRRGRSQSLQNGRPQKSTISKTSIKTSQIHTHQIYLALIVLLMLSEDDFFKKVIHEMMLKNVEWYQPDRAPIAEITLGGLIILVFAKTIQINTIRLRDRYFHVNSLATLANLSSCFKQLTPFVCQKLIGLLETMTKRHAKLIRAMRENAERDPVRKISKNDDDLDLEELQDGNDDLHSDITALEEGIRTLLEIINACLCRNLRNNPNLIYTVLYKRELFEHYHQHPMFQDLVWNIYAVINHFTARVEAIISANSGNNSPTFGGGNAASANAIANNASVSDILEAIKKTAIEWPTDRLKKFPDLRFKYIEDDNTVDFFVPYIWRLIYESAGIYFDPIAIQLFNAVD